MSSVDAHPLAFIFALRMVGDIWLAKQEMRNRPVRSSICVERVLLSQLYHQPQIRHSAPGIWF